MKIEVKYNIDFGKALKELEGNKLSEHLNKGVSDNFAKNSTKFIQSGKVKPKLSKNNPRGQKAPPLFDTGKLAKSLKGSSRGITGVDYAKDHLKEGGYPWKGIQIRQRKFNTADLPTEKSANNKIYKEFEKKFVNLLSKRIRKR